MGCKDIEMIKPEFVAKHCSLQKRYFPPIECFLYRLIQIVIFSVSLKMIKVTKNHSIQFSRLINSMNKNAPEGDGSNLLTTENSLTKKMAKNTCVYCLFF